MSLPTVTDVYEARRRLGSRIPRTPLLQSSWLSSIADGNVHLKIESLNLTSSFKIRGALNAALRLSEGIDAEPPTIVAASASITAARSRWPPKSSVFRASFSRRRMLRRRRRLPFAATAPSCIRIAKTTTRLKARPRHSPRPKAQSISPPTTIPM
jgi:hypothetical protein